MKRFVVVSSLLLLASHLAYSRSIADEGKSVSDGSFLQWPLSATTVTCEPVYGFLPCTSNGWGLLFMIVVYNILLSIGGQYVGAASDLWLQIIGPGVVGGSVFQFLGTIPQLVMMLLPILTGSTEEAQLRATSGMGMVFGGVAILLTLIWGLTVVLGSYDPSEDDETDTSEAHKAATANAGSSIVTDVETGWTARLVLVASVPYLILELQNAVTSSSGKRVLILIALIVTVALLCGYVLYQSFQPWIQSRCFEFMVDKYAKDKLLKLITANGRPNTKKIQGLFNKIDKDNNASVTAAEVRVLVLGVQMDDNDTSTDLVLDEITTYFDTSGDGGISQDEFVKGMTKLAFTLLDQTPTQITKVGNNSSQITSPDQEALLGSITSTSQTISNTWSIYFRATFFLVFGIAIACTLSSPLMKSIMEFATAVNVSSFWVSYLVLPLALNYGKILETISLAAQKSQRTNSLMLSSLYSGVFMGNIIGLLPFLVPVYFRNLSSDVSAELHLVLLLCIFMGTYTSFNTTFPRWTGYVALILYPISLATVYVITSVL
ncbi:sodium/calcium exchanger NCL2-like isoform X2 [Salvia miltiorrhiza]|uniref:sodium/calcium exchanger NCL2-like isoform X2 n=1 Tax=Salvia miltiorrhiza TaxID=226208 RepID=UPI0025AC8843|nr:sodium/calcium exchanger NCL2-like isoform X2 [Salvia miltiorrhiza]